MARISCPECGRYISDRAQVCPRCGFPLADAREAEMRRIEEEERSGNLVRIKLYPFDQTHGTGRQTASIKIKGAGRGGKWSGYVGGTASFRLSGVYGVTVKYKSNGLQFGGKCKGVINTAESRRYIVSAQKVGRVGKTLAISAVDVF